MSDHESRETTHDLLKLDEICSEFETDWTLDSISLIAGLVIEADSNAQEILVSELISIDLEMRQSQCETVNTEEYLLRLPGYSDAVKKTLDEFNSHNSGEQTQLDSQQDVPTENEEFNIDTAPLRIGDYQIIRRIGRGGVGVVYEGIQESLGRRVAIKMLSRGHLNSQVLRFQREAKAIAMLHHTNIVKVFGSGIQDGTPYFAMQLIDGQNLAEVIDACRKNQSKSVGIRSQKEVAKIGVQVARALEHAHQKGVLHRDIKPSNLLLDNNGTTWVTDFGLAKLVDDQSKHAKTAGVVGTIRYVPPEGFSSEWSERSDVYSLGLTLYELLVLKPAFPGDDFRQLVNTISNGLSPLDQVKNIDGVDQDLETIIFKAVEREPHRRYESAGELADDLQRYIDGLPIKARPASATEKTLRWAKRNPAAAGLAMLTMMVAFIGLPVVLWLWMQTSSALQTVEAQQQSIVESRDDAEATRYSSTTLLAQNYMDNGLGQQARRTLNELIAGKNGKSEGDVPWEIQYLDQRLDTSEMTLKSASSDLAVWKVAVSHDDQQVASIHSIAPEEAIPGKVLLWDFETGEQTHVLQDNDSCVFGCAFSQDNQRLATIGMNFDKPNNRGTLSTWDTKTGRRISQIELPGTYEKQYLYIHGFAKLPGVAFSSDDKLTITWPDPVEVRNSQTLELLWKCKGLYALVLPGDRVLVHNGRDLEIRELSTGQIVGGIKNIHNVSELKLSANGKMLSCIGIDRMFVWDSIEKMNEFQVISIKGINWGTLSPDGTEIIYSAGKGELTLNSLDRGNPNSLRSLLGHQGTVNHGCFSQHGEWLLTGGIDGTIKRWPLKNPKQRVASTKLAHERISNISFSEDGDQIHFAARRVVQARYSYNSGSIDLKELVVPTKKQIASTHMATWPRGDFAFSPDRKYLAAPVAEPSRPDEIIGFAKVSEVGIWDCDSWEKQKDIDTQFSSIKAIQWNLDSELIAVAGETSGRHSVKFFKIKSEVPTKIGELDFEDSIVALGFHKSKLAVSTTDQISVWELKKSPGNCLEFNNEFESTAQGRLVCLDFSPDADRLACADNQNDNLILFDVLSGAQLYQRPGPRAFCCVTFSPCGKRLALSGYDAIVHLCDADSGYRLLQLAGQDPSPGTNSINSRVIFSPDGKRIATNTWQGKIRLWEINDKQANPR